jgi:hypothetical protein
MGSTTVHWCRQSLVWPSQPFKKSPFLQATDINTANWGNVYTFSGDITYTTCPPPPAPPSPPPAPPTPSPPPPSPVT